MEELLVMRDDGVIWSATDADIAAHVAALPHDQAVALLLALLRARPEAAVEAVDTAKVARAWSDGTPAENGMKFCVYCGGELREVTRD